MLLAAFFIAMLEMPAHGIPAPVSALSVPTPTAAQSIVAAASTLQNPCPQGPSGNQLVDPPNIYATNGRVESDSDTHERNTRRIPGLVLDLQIAHERRAGFLQRTAYAQRAARRKIEDHVGQHASAP